MKVLVLGANGMIGSAIFRILIEKDDWKVFGSVRLDGTKELFSPEIGEHMIPGIDIRKEDALSKVFNQIHPDVVINCIGLTKHLPQSENPLLAIPINALFPHQLAHECGEIGARLVHISTDCVYSGRKGGYLEDDASDATDIYGKSKFLGEVDYPHAITLRTSTIGHEFRTNYGLLEWFLSQENKCKGYTRAVFSGLTTVYLAEIIRDVVVPRADLSGLYHVSGESITKYDLLQLIARVYGKSIEIIPDDQLVIDRSLRPDRFIKATGYVVPQWPALIEAMHSYRLRRPEYV